MTPEKIALESHSCGKNGTLTDEYNIIKNNSNWLLSKSEHNNRVLLSIVALMTRIALLFIKPLGIAIIAWTARFRCLDNNQYESCYFSTRFP